MKLLFAAAPEKRYEQQQRSVTEWTPYSQQQEQQQPLSLSKTDGNRRVNIIFLYD